MAHKKIHADHSSRQEMFTLTQAFDPFYVLDGVDEQTANQERVILSVSFLLDYLACSGMEQIDGTAAQGLAKCLFLTAENMARRRNRKARFEREGELAPEDNDVIKQVDGKTVLVRDGKILGEVKISAEYARKVLAASELASDTGSKPS